MENKQIQKSHLWIYFVAILLIVIIGILIYNVIRNETKPETQTKQQQSQDYTEQNEENSLPTLGQREVKMPEKIGEYEILGEIEIPKINVKKYILDQTTDESLKLSLTKFWGPNLHEIGNFSIIGHNYDGLFKRLKELQTGDTFTLTARDDKIGIYEVYDSYIVNPDEMECIEHSLIGQREVTLITCTVGGTQRLIVKAKEKN